jgi:hypothetical protein
MNGLVAGKPSTGCDTECEDREDRSGCKDGKNQRRQIWKSGQADMHAKKQVRRYRVKCTELDCTEDTSINSET